MTRLDRFRHALYIIMLSTVGVIVNQSVTAYDKAFYSTRNNNREGR